jgi:hypothetical protein
MHPWTGRCDRTAPPRAAAVAAPRRPDGHRSPVALRRALGIGRQTFAIGASQPAHQLARRFRINRSFVCHFCHGCHNRLPQVLGRDPQAVPREVRPQSRADPSGDRPTWADRAGAYSVSGGASRFSAEQKHPPARGRSRVTLKRAVVDSSGWIEVFTNGRKAEHFLPLMADNRALVVLAMTILEAFKWVLREHGEAQAIQALHQGFDHLAGGGEAEAAQLHELLGAGERPLAQGPIVRSAAGQGSHCHRETGGSSRTAHGPRRDILV